MSEQFRTSIQDAMDTAAEKVGIEGWMGYSWEAVGDDNLVTGCVPDGVYSKGPRKGRTRFSKPVEGTKTRVVVTDDEVQRFAKRFEESTGKCFECKGTGEVFSGWSQSEGAKTAPCARCFASGKPRGNST